MSGSILECHLSVILGARKDISVPFRAHGDYILADGGLDSSRPIVQVQEVWAGPSVVGYDSVFPYDILSDRSRALGVADAIVYPFYERR